MMGSQQNTPTRHRKQQQQQSKISHVVNPSNNNNNSNVYYTPQNLSAGRRRQQQQQQQQPQMYNFNTDRSYRYLDVDLTPYVRDLTTRFVAWIILTFLIELILLAWPITATAIWSTWAALTWMSFGYALRLLTLVATVIGVGSRMHRLAGRPVTRAKNPHRFISLTLGTAFAPSAPLKIWYVLAWVQGILTIFTLLFTLATAPLFSSNNKNLVLGLSLGFQILSILQSLSWPGILYTYAIRVPLRFAVLSARQGKRRVRY